MKEFCIYIDGLFYKGAGIGRYYESLTKELSNRNIKIITSIPKKLRNEFEKDFAEYPNIEPIFVDYEKFSLKGFYQHSKILKELKNKVDLFFYPHINLPYYIPERTVITIHDLRPFTPYWDRNKIKLNIFGYFLKRAVLYSQRIICISKTVETSLLSFYSAAENKTCVIYRFIDEKFMSNEFTKPIIPGSYVLFVGSRKKHKNLGMLIKSFNNIKRIVPHNLVIAGSKESDFDEIDDLKEILHLKDRIIEVLSPDDNT
ncbi:MAG TPA: glycosyltransferase, partial [bacterium]|nr:glycosyltransferase [bacterium]